MNKIDVEQPLLETFPNLPWFGYASELFGETVPRVGQVTENDWGTETGKGACMERLQDDCCNNTFQQYASSVSFLPKIGTFYVCLNFIIY